MPGQPAIPGGVYHYDRPTRWAFDCFLCPDGGGERRFNFATKAKAEAAFTAHRATYHALEAG